MDITTLENPPIYEALLEIRFNPNKDVEISKLEKFANSLKDEFSKIESVETQIFEFNYSKEDGSKHEFNIQPSGFKLTNSQENRIVVCAMDKLTVSYLAPYKSWPALCESMKSTFAQYLKFVPQNQIIRLGMRYINKINLPLEGKLDFDDYIKTFQPLPKYMDEIPDKLSGIESKIIIPFPDINCQSTVRQVLLPIDVKKDLESGYVTFILDIDLYNNKIIETMDGGEIWETFNAMRSKKNAIFFASLTDKAIKPYL